LVIQESYNKRLNILKHRIKEDSDNLWEKRDETSDKFKNFLIDGLKINDLDEVEFIDIHRLPQHLVKKERKTVHRPIIVKLLTMADKNMIFNKVKNLKTYNNELKGALNPNFLTWTRKREKYWH